MGVIVNSGNANACTGKDGMKAALKMTRAVEAALGLGEGDILVASTGVIGVPLPVKKAEAGVGPLVGALRYDGFNDALGAIMTTDAFPKAALVTGRVNGKTVTITGLAKGAGMICPNMATMLAFFMTDAVIGKATLRRALKDVVDATFNSIIVDNDTSTNDTVLIFANGVSKGREIKAGTPGYRAFCKLLYQAASKLAHLIVKDGEGATRFIEISVNGAASAPQARAAARTVAESYLVKTAFFGGDPNWGRIMAALGRAGIKMDESRVDIRLNGVSVVRRGLDTGKEVEAAHAIKVKEVAVRIELGMGKAAATAWTSDLSHEYVRINSAYRT